MTLTYISSNSRKIDEVKYFFGNDINVQNCELVEIQGNIKQVVEHKLDEAIKIIGERNFFIDDVSCEILGLYGFPGPYFKDFIKLGNKAIEDIVSKIGRNFKITCNIGLYYNGTKYFFTGEYCGYIKMDSNENHDNFDWSKIIRLKSGKKVSDLTFNERIEHLARGKALFELKKYLSNNLN